MCRELPLTGEAGIPGAGSSPGAAAGARRGSQLRTWPGCAERSRPPRRLIPRRRLHTSAPSPPGTVPSKMNSFRILAPTLPGTGAFPPARSPPRTGRAEPATDSSSRGRCRPARAPRGPIGTARCEAGKGEAPAAAASAGMLRDRHRRSLRAPHGNPAREPGSPGPAREPRSPGPARELRILRPRTGTPIPRPRTGAPHPPAPHGNPASPGPAREPCIPRPRTGALHPPAPHGNPDPPAPHPPVPHGSPAPPGPAREPRMPGPASPGPAREPRMPGPPAAARLPRTQGAFAGRAVRARPRQERPVTPSARCWRTRFLSLSAASVSASRCFFRLRDVCNSHKLTAPFCWKCVILGQSPF
ncbi:uncharacterized protein LOC128792960 [Vidua chalybeata]|uniref:uncharacterized protein LOC128792960 n=1 Tax=Vidua chalybeata TaxID=81927 RepID=UPI0023A8B7AD|nr:uncharacterized protein LOC128792960 [Vidua chalybeata]